MSSHFTSSYAFQRKNMKSQVKYEPSYDWYNEFNLSCLLNVLAQTYMIWKKEVFQISCHKKINLIQFFMQEDLNVTVSWPEICLGFSNIWVVTLQRFVTMELFTVWNIFNIQNISWDGPTPSLVCHYTNNLFLYLRSRTKPRTVWILNLYTNRQTTTAINFQNKNN